MKITKNVKRNTINLLIVLAGAGCGILMASDKIVPIHLRLAGIIVSMGAAVLAIALIHALRNYRARESQLRELAHAFTKLDAPLTLLYDALQPFEPANLRSEYLAWKDDYIDRNGGALRVVALVMMGILPEVERVHADDGEEILRALRTVFEPTAEVSVDA